MPGNRQLEQVGGLIRSAQGRKQLCELFVAFDPHGSAFEGLPQSCGPLFSPPSRCLRGGKADQHSAIPRRERSSMLKQRHGVEPRLHRGVGVAVSDCEIVWRKTRGLGEGLQCSLMFID